MQHTVISSTEEISFLPPEGKYPGRLVSVKDLEPTEAKPNPLVRLLFELEVPNSKGVKFMAARNFRPNFSTGSSLHWFIQAWAGEKVAKAVEMAGSLWGMINEQGLVTVKHVQGDGFSRPFVNIDKVEPLQPALTKTVTVTVPKFVQVQPENTNTVSTNTSTSAQAFLSASRPEKCVCCGQALPVTKE